jgi:hypothetical protein
VVSAARALLHRGPRHNSTTKPAQQAQHKLAAQNAGRLEPPGAQDGSTGCSQPHPQHRQLVSASGWDEHRSRNKSCTSTLVPYTGKAGLNRPHDTQHALKPRSTAKSVVRLSSRRLQLHNRASD